ncbi:MAG: radical SAM protein [Candidatus Fermentibacteraceae bacterium]|nr:radical SAM protein [Candidatus Fermentibacteraceae bacterium]MBN2609216.1 radical SAM protein [Candidatus Fermentibacteraceae bacterium]
MRIVLMTMPALWEQDQHDFMNTRRFPFRWLKIRPLVNVVPSPSLLYLAPFLKEDGHEVHYLEGLFYTFEKTVSKIREIEPGIIGVTLTSVDWENSRWMLNELKEQFPGSLIVAGGIHPTLWKEKCFRESTGIDVLVIGEGEHTMRELASAVERGAGPTRTDGLKDVKGLMYMQDGGLVTTPPRDVTEDIDTLPFPSHELVDVNAYIPSPTFYKSLPHANIIGARGCPYQCIFCHTDRHVRMRSAANIVDEIEILYRDQGVTDIAFWDDTFTLSKKRAMEFCGEMIDREIRVSWAVNARVDRVDRELLEEMRRAGCWRVLYGIESGVQKNLDTLKKGTSLDQIRNAVSMTAGAGIEAYGTFMFGIPGETFEEGLRTIEFACSLPLDYAVFVNLTPLPGTEVYEDLLSGSITPAKFTENRFNFKNVSFVPEGMTEEQIRYLIQAGHRRFYMRPRLIWKKIRSIRSFFDLSKYIRGFLLIGTSEYSRPPTPDHPPLSRTE